MRVCAVAPLLPGLGLLRQIVSHAPASLLEDLLVGTQVAMCAPVVVYWWCADAAVQMVIGGGRGRCWHMIIGLMQGC